MGFVLALLGALLLAGSVIVLVPVSVLVIQILAARAGRNGVAVASAQRRPSMVVLMPAHNEAAGISIAIDAVLRQLQPADRLVVIADNCSDDTAAVATSCDA